MGRFIPEIVKDSVRYDSNKRDSVRVFLTQIAATAVFGVLGYEGAVGLNAELGTDINPWAGSTAGLGLGMLFVAFANLGALGRERREAYREGAMDQSDTVVGRN